MKRAMRARGWAAAAGLALAALAAGCQPIPQPVGYHGPILGPDGQPLPAPSWTNVAPPSPTPPPGPGPVAPTNTPPQPGAAARRAVVAGLTAVSPAAYGGWAGDCPGCDIDAREFAALSRLEGLEVAELHNSAATKAGFLAAARKALTGMAAGDLLVLYVSGHGGQVADADGDEDDRQDETLCLWDGQLSDDVLRKLWEELPAGVRVFYVTDTCNSGTNYRYRPRALGAPLLPRGFQGGLIHYGGCADGKSSYGGADGGAFTLALRATWRRGIGYKAWLDAAAARMDRSQVPYYAEYGTVPASFRDAAAFH